MNSLFREKNMRASAEEQNPLRHPPTAWLRLLSTGLLLSFCAGCASIPGDGAHESARRSLHPLPKIYPEGLRSDQTLVAAFFTANGLHLSTAQVKAILPDFAPQGQLDRAAIRKIATQNNRLLRVVKADERFLWDELGDNHPLLILLPSGIRYNPASTPLIPLAWNKKDQTIELLDGSGEIHSIDETSFFERRDPLKHAALRLVNRTPLFRTDPIREQKLLFADFWFDQNFYRRTDATFTAIQEDPFITNADVDSLLARGNTLIRKGRYKEAIPVFRAALDLDPQNPKTLNNLAYAMLHGGGELLTALRYAKKANRLDPRNPLVLETLGTLNLRLGDALAAARYLEQAWAQGLKRSPDIQVAIMDQLVRAWLAADRLDLAWQVAEHRHRSFPDYRFPKDILLNFPSLSRTLPHPGPANAI